MSDPLEYGPDTGLRELWLFTLFVKKDEVPDWEPPRMGQSTDNWALEEALGAGPLDPEHVQVFTAADLGPSGLRRFIADAHGMDEGQVAADAEKLDALQGTVALVLSGALKQRPGRFSLERRVNFIGRYAAPQALSPSMPSTVSASTEGHIAPPAAPAPDTRRGLVLTLAGLLALALLIFAFV